MDDKNTGDYRCGWSALVGRPNIGKSTLINRIIGQKVSIVSRRPQTTRHRILGVLTRDNYQLVLVDTPGIHRSESKYLNRVFNRAATSSLDSVDVNLMMIDARGWHADDDKVLERIKRSRSNTLLLINKIDLVKDKTRLLPLLELCSKKHDFREIVPISASKGNGVEQLLKSLYTYLPGGQADFPKKMVTDRTQRFMAAELVREQIFIQLGEELPYTSAVQLDNFEQTKSLYRISVIIWVDKASHKPIFLGKKGSRLKNIGTQARREMEMIFSVKVYLQLWVKVKEGWAESDLSLRTLGYLEE
jgi:GTP-binding protein Era